MTARTGDLTVGGITSTLLRFTLPMMLGSLMQQCYNIADTLIVGRCIGSDALAAVGSAYSLMTFLISVLLGLAMGSGTVFSLQFGAGNMSGLRRSIYVSLVLIGCVTAALTVASFALIDPILRMLQVPAEIYDMLRLYLLIIFGGIPLTFLYNFYAALLRAVGDSVTPLWFLGVSVVLNIVLDLLFILGFGMGVDGAAIATVAAQGVSALGLMVYVLYRRPELRVRREDMLLDGASVREIASFSSLTCVQQSVMNFGILMVQGLVNTFGTAVMAAFAAAVKIDSFAYMPVQEFGNAFSTLCVLHVYGTELRCWQVGAYTEGSPERIPDIGAVLSDCLAPGLSAGTAADAHLRAGGRGGNHPSRSAVPAGRRFFLLRHRHPFPAVRLLPCHPHAGHVRGADRPIARHPRSPGIHPRGHSFHRCHRYLVVHPHRMGPG